MGYYGAGNEGDERIKAAWRHILGTRHRLVFLRHDRAFSKRYLSRFDWILIGGGGLVFKPVGIWQEPERWIATVRGKIGLAGLGINQIDDVLGKSLHTIASHSSFFFVRDSESSRLAENYGCSAEIYPDLTWSLPQRAAAQQPTRVALSLAPCWWKDFDVARWKMFLPKENFAPIPMDPRDVSILQEALDRPVAARFSLRSLANSKYLIGARYHALLFALQLRRPVIAIAYDHKISRLMAEAGLSDYCLGTNEPERLPEVISLLHSRMADVHVQIEAFASIQEARGAEMAGQIIKMIESEYRFGNAGVNSIQSWLRRLKSFHISPI